MKRDENFNTENYIISIYERFSIDIKEAQLRKEIGLFFVSIGRPYFFKLVGNSELIIFGINENELKDLAYIMHGIEHFSNLKIKTL